MSLGAGKQRGVALFTAIFLIVVLAAIGVSVALITTTQQVSSAQAVDATRAYYAARARLERAIAESLGPSGGPPGTQGCPSTTGPVDIAGFTTTLDCPPPVTVSEGGATYNVVLMTATASRGDRTAGTRVRRQIRVQITAF